MCKQHLRCQIEILLIVDWAFRLPHPLLIQVSILLYGHSTACKAGSEERKALAWALNTFLGT